MPVNAYQIPSKKKLKFYIESTVDNISNTMVGASPWVIYFNYHISCSVFGCTLLMFSRNNHPINNIIIVYFVQIIETTQIVFLV